MNNYQSFAQEFGQVEQLVIPKTSSRMTVPDKFWCNGKKQKDCCFNHQIGLPTRKIKTLDGSSLDGLEMPIFPYEMIIIENLENYKFYALNKARGIGATEIILRWILWKALLNKMPNRKFLIITGINSELAKDEMSRLKQLLCNIPSVIKSQSAFQVRVNNSIIMALPARPAAIRGLENVEVIFLDESAHWGLVDDTPVLEAAEPHRTKSDAWIIVVSTPNGRRGFFSKIFHDEETPYYKDSMPWLVSLGLLIEETDVLQIKKSDPYKYEQEYNCQFLTTRYSAIPQEALDKLEHSGEGFTLQ